MIFVDFAVVREMRRFEKDKVALCVALVALVALVQVVELKGQGRRTELGEDADFDVKSWRWAACPLPPLLSPPRCQLFFVGVDASGLRRSLTERPR